MGKERLVELAKRGIRSTGEFVKTKPRTALLGAAGVGGAFNGSSLGLSVVSGNEIGIVLNSIVLTIYAGAVGVAPKLKNSKSVTSNLVPQNNL